MNQGSGDGRPLHFPSAELVRKMTRSVRQGYQIQHFEGRGSCLSRGSSGEQEGHFHIFSHIHRWEQIKELEDNPEFRAPIECQFSVVSPLKMHSVNHHLARGGVIQSSQKIQQRALPRSAGTRDGDELTPVNFQRNVIQGDHRWSAIGAGGFDETDHSVHK